MSTAALQIAGLSKRFGGLPATKDVSIEVMAGASAVSRFISLDEGESFHATGSFISASENSRPNSASNRDDANHDEHLFPRVKIRGPIANSHSGTN